MDTYKEYSIRCKSCNEQIACFASDFEDLVSAGLTKEEALNQLGIMAYCSRISFTDPTIVSFDMENRQVIEGFKSVAAATDADAHVESTIRPMFNPCISSPLTLGPISPLLTVLPTPVQPPIQVRTQPRSAFMPNKVQLPTIGNAVSSGTQLNKLPSQPLTLAMSIKPIVPIIQQTKAAPTRILPQTKTTAHPRIDTLADDIVAPILSGIELDTDIEALGFGIPILENENDVKFRDPTTVGVPTINSNPKLVRAQIYVGAGKNANILNGRTYLAQ